MLLNLLGLFYPTNDTHLLQSTWLWVLREQNTLSWMKQNCLVSYYSSKRPFTEMWASSLTPISSVKTQGSILRRNNRGPSKYGLAYSFRSPPTMSYPRRRAVLSKDTTATTTGDNFTERGHSLAKILYLWHTHTHIMCCQRTSQHTKRMYMKPDDKHSHKHFELRICTTVTVDPAV